MADLMNKDVRDAVLAWLASQFEVVTEEGGNTIEVAGEALSVITADVVQDDEYSVPSLCVMLSNNEVFAIELKEV